GLRLIHVAGRIGRISPPMPGVGQILDSGSQGRYLESRGNPDPGEATMKAAHLAHFARLIFVFGLLLATRAGAEPPADIKDLKLGDWKPKSMLNVKTTQVDQPKFPVIDVHNHLGGGKATLTPDRVASYLEEMN